MKDNIIVKYKEEDFPKEDTSKALWAKFIESHGYRDWHEMSDVLLKSIRWNGCITYKDYSKWFDMYHTPLMRALREEEK